jgi:hypothetical protein
MKRIAFYVLHYGKEYLAWSIRSVQDAVDEIHILYSDRPSFSYETELVCPDSEEELKKEAYRFLSKPLFWHRGHWKNETEHRNTIYGIAKERGIGQILVVDSDELWETKEAAAALDRAAARPERHVLARFIHFWRSLHWACEDPSMPVRIINVTNKEGTWYLSPQDAPVLHFGYAQSECLTAYKQSVHGHKAEWRPRWFEEKFLPWTPGSSIKDVHPTNGSDFWTPKPTNEKIKRIVEELLGGHVYLGREVIR